MMTVKEISKITGISVRTLHYYDEIQLLVPTAKNEAGYRLYDDKALETLQQILFFREFDISLKQIKSIMETPELDKDQILRMQRNMLVSKKEHIEQLINNIDDILKGDNRMNFEIFNETEIQDMYDSMVANMREDQKAFFIEHYGSMDAFQKHFLESASSEAAQQNMKKVVEWYGDKKKAVEASTNPADPDLFFSYQHRMEIVLKKLSAMKGRDVHSLEVKEVVGEYDFISKQLYQMSDVSKMMLDLGQLYQTNKEVQQIQDSIYGEGATEFWGRAIEAFYQKPVE